MVAGVLKPTLFNKNSSIQSQFYSDKDSDSSQLLQGLYFARLYSDWLFFCQKGPAGFACPPILWQTKTGKSSEQLRFVPHSEDVFQAALRPSGDLKPIVKTAIKGILPNRVWVWWTTQCMLCWQMTKLIIWCTSRKLVNYLDGRLLKLTTKF